MYGRLMNPSTHTHTHSTRCRNAAADDDGDDVDAVCPTVLRCFVCGVRSTLISPRASVQRKSTSTLRRNWKGPVAAVVAQVRQRSKRWRRRGAGNGAALARVQVCAHGCTYAYLHARMRSVRTDADFVCERLHHLAQRMHNSYVMCTRTHVYCALMILRALSISLCRPAWLPGRLSSSITQCLLVKFSN